jgi:hypothetical protein
MEQKLQALAPMSPHDAMLQRVRGEYSEMPGLCLTFAQACRLWNVDLATGRRVLEALVAEGFLARRPDGSFIAQAMSSLRQAALKAALTPDPALPRSA